MMVRERMEVFDSAAVVDAYIRMAAAAFDLLAATDGEESRDPLIFQCIRQFRGAGEPDMALMLILVFHVHACGTDEERDGLAAAMMECPSASEFVNRMIDASEATG